MLKKKVPVLNKMKTMQAVLALVVNLFVGHSTQLCRPLLDSPARPRMEWSLRCRTVLVFLVRVVPRDLSLFPVSEVVGQMLCLENLLPELVRHPGELEGVDFPASTLQESVVRDLYDRDRRTEEEARKSGWRQ